MSITYPTPNFDDTSVTLTHTSKNDAILQHDVWGRTTRLNKQYGLQDHEEIVWKVHKNFPTDGATTQMVVYGLSLVLFLMYMLGIAANVLTVTAICMMFILTAVYSFNWKLLIPAILHDYLCRYKTMHGYIYDNRLSVITDEIGNIPVKRSTADLIMFDKIGSFRGTLLRFIVYPAIALFGKLF